MNSRLRLFVRGASTAPALSLFLVVVIAALSYLGLAAPALLAEGRTATIQSAVSSVPELARWPSATTPGLPAFDDAATGDAGVWSRALDEVEQKRREQPEPLRNMLGAPRMVMTVDPFPSKDDSPDRVEPVPQNKVALVADPGMTDRAELVDGRLPEITAPGDGIEIALTEAVAEQLIWPLGTTRRWEDRTVVLTGIVAPNDENDQDWAFINGSLRPAVEVTASGDRILVASAFMHPDEAAALVDRVSDIKVVSWMPFDTAALDGATAQQAAAQLRLLSADPVDIPMYDRTFYNRGLPFSSALPQAIDTGLSRADAMTAVVSIAAVGPVTVALVVLALVSRMLAVRRVTPTRVLRARGASTEHLIARLGGEGAALGLLGAVFGAAAAAAVSGWAGTWTLVVPLALAAAPVIALPWGALTDAGRHERRDLGDTVHAGVSRWRLALEILVLALTAALPVLVVARGAAGGADPLLLALPVLLGATGSIVTLRLLPLLLRAAERRARRRAGLAALLGPARARRDPVVRTAPVLAVVIGLGVAIFSVAFAATVTQGIARSAAVAAGAEVRVDSAYIAQDAADRVAALDGVAAMAALRGDMTVDVSAGTEKTRAHLYTVDRDDMVAVQRDTMVPLPLPESLTADDDEGVPIVVSQPLMARLGTIAGADGDIEVGGTAVRVVGTVDPQVPFGSAEQWIIVDAAHARTLGERGTGRSQLYLSLAPGADPDAVGAAAAAALGEGASFQTPASIAAGYTDDPAFSLVRSALLAASGVVAVLLGVAVVAMLVLGAPARARMLAILRTLGHPRRAAGRLVAWEVVPALLLALPFGVAAGVTMAWLVIPALDLRGFVGGPAQPAVALGGVWPLFVVVGFAMVAAVAVAAATVLASRLHSAQAIRGDDEREL
ncbi:hypothetical protein GCM10025768_12870 [Microbacterium pseudoresistens]|uniref:Putative ABC transport system permease protein n=1 Tax=Microbacterium pseudoresistens TaxID=640634 RepID=A0A7Y9EY31_9MICO|nr:FtsX-like permease family protein [Microbacterium pseudoresistens]NYD55190.1 putative ABC transport system permease protein [Microbacterium pseudoresistens]